MLKMEECLVVAKLHLLPSVSTPGGRFFAVTRMTWTCGPPVYQSARCQGVWSVRPSTVLSPGRSGIYDAVIAFGTRILAGPVPSRPVSKTVLPEVNVTSY
jgi:hypothetical protein